MGVASKIWNGPFKAPAIQHPITVGWVLLKILETVWRLVLIVVLLAALLAAAIWWTTRESSSIGSEIAISVASDPIACPEKRLPVNLTLHNRSNVNVGEVGIRFRAYPAGKSADVVSPYDGITEVKDIMRPGEELGYCFPMPDLLSGSEGPHTIAADVSYATEVADDVPLPERPKVTPAKKRFSDRSILEKSLHFAGALAVLALAAGGGLGLLMLYDRIFGTRIADLQTDKGEDRGCAPVFVASIANGIFVFMAGWGLASIDLDGWLVTIDRWSRMNGYSDGGTLLVFGVACLWPWLVLSLWRDRLETAADPSAA